MEGGTVDGRIQRHVLCIVSVTYDAEATYCLSLAKILQETCKQLDGWRHNGRPHAGDVPSPPIYYIWLWSQRCLLF
jgi:hypothetical protein